MGDHGALFNSEEVGTWFQAIGSSWNHYAIWLRFPKLAVEYYQQEVLYTIGKLVGEPLKVDLNTAATVGDKSAKVKSAIFVTRISN